MADPESSEINRQNELLTSENYIDLTNDVEYEPTRRWVPEPHSRSQEPQSVGSSNAVSMGNIVDLTNDQEQNDGDEVIFTGQRTIFLRQNAPQSGPRQQHNGNYQRTTDLNSPSLLVPPASVLPVVPPRYRFTTIRNGSGSLAVDLTSFGQMFSSHSMENIPTLWHLGALHSMANHFDYGNHSFEQRSNVNHVPPPPVARENFTRSPTTSDILVCPSCEEELTHNKEDSLAKKPNKNFSRKDREEHPFWVVKECGHVYCNKCFQSRGDKAKLTGFRGVVVRTPNTKSGSKKSLLCAVSDCRCDVKGKDKWVGVFL